MRVAPRGTNRFTARDRQRAAMRWRRHEEQEREVFRRGGMEREGTERVAFELTEDFLVKVTMIM